MASIFFYRTRVIVCNAASQWWFAGERSWSFWPVVALKRWGCCDRTFLNIRSWNEFLAFIHVNFWSWHCVFIQFEISEYRFCFVSILLTSVIGDSRCVLLSLCSWFICVWTFSDEDFSSLDSFSVLSEAAIERILPKEGPRVLFESRYFNWKESRESVFVYSCSYLLSLSYELVICSLFICSLGIV